MIRNFVLTLSPRETRMLRWSAAASVAALWFAFAWRDLWVLLLVPMIAGWFLFLVFRGRRDSGHPLEDEEEPDWY
ncbi:MAG: hypothetical protein M3R70_05185 [Actinomycetota bacterium]|nr:hypothetical protein [Actinomycetota bacterium]